MNSLMGHLAAFEEEERIKYRKKWGPQWREDMTRRQANGEERVNLDTWIRTRKMSEFDIDA